MNKITLKETMEEFATWLKDNPSIPIHDIRHANNTLYQRVSRQHPGKFHGALRELGIRYVRRRGRRPVLREGMLAALHSGLSMTDIAIQFGVSRQRIEQILMRYANEQGGIRVKRLWCIMRKPGKWEVME